MGVPSFFKYLVNQYKRDNFILQREKQNDTNRKKLESIDYLCLDANGLMHPVCFKVLAENPKMELGKELDNKMYIAILQEIDNEVINDDIPVNLDEINNKIKKISEKNTFFKKPDIKQNDIKQNDIKQYDIKQ